MSDNITRIFSPDSETFSFQNSKDNIGENLPQLESPFLSNEDYYVSSLDRSRNSIQSVDHRIKEAIKPLIEDMEVLKPKKFNALLNETHSILVKTTKDENTPEIKESLHSLISLLEENADLLNLYQSYTNWLQKA